MTLVAYRWVTLNLTVNALNGSLFRTGLWSGIWPASTHVDQTDNRYHEEKKKVYLLLSAPIKKKKKDIIVLIVSISSCKFVHIM